MFELKVIDITVRHPSEYSIVLSFLLCLRTCIAPFSVLLCVGICICIVGTGTIVITVAVVLYGIVSAIPERARVFPGSHNECF